MIRPVFAEIAGSWPSLLSFAQMSAVRRSCQTMARWTGGAGGAVPHHGGLALVGDADRGDVLCRDIGLLQRLAAGGNGRGPDVLRLVLDPARGRKMLRKLRLRRRGDRDVGPKHDGARGCGALIDGQHKGHDVFSWRCFPGGVVGLRRGKRIGNGSSISIVVPAKAGTHTPRPIDFAKGVDHLVFIESTTRYGSLRLRSLS